MATQKDEKLKQITENQEQNTQTASSSSSYGFSLTGIDMDPALIAQKLPPNRMYTDFSAISNGCKGYTTEKASNVKKGFFASKPTIKPQIVIEEVAKKIEEESSKISDPPSP